MLGCLLKRLWVGKGLPQSQAFHSASGSKWPPVSTLECVMLL